MADGALNLTLDDYTSAKLAEKAKALGVAPAVIAAEILHRALDDVIADPRPVTQPEDYKGPYVDLEDALSAFDHELERRLAKRAE